ncbi:MAG TPA: winged helix DNA-binding domain-containing protein [Propionibacteriaceae bacterium]|nr:winged helix DNA-binding domain-containing protein [Propionibacteriaceae bacterium]
MAQIDVEERRARLADRHRLLPRTRTDDLAAIADGLVALHSTDPVTVYLSAMLRMVHPSIAAVEHALYADRGLIRHHAMRRTLWVATPPVVRQIHAAATRKLVGPERRRVIGWLAEAGIADPDGWLDGARDQILSYLHQHGPTTARELGQQVPALRQPLVMAAGTPWEAKISAHTRVITLLGFQGEILRARPTGSWVNGAYRYAAADTWLPGGLGELDERAAAADLARLWLPAFGPATTVDLSWWMGWTKAMTRRALADAGAVEVALDDGPGWIAGDDEGPPEVEPWVAALPGLDPTTMGWKQRSWYLPAAAAEAFDRAGNGGPTIWVDGRIVGVWAQTRAGEILTHYFEQVAADRRRQVDERIADIRQWVGDTRFTMRFPADIHRALVG